MFIKKEEYDRLVAVEQAHQTLKYQYDQARGDLDSSQHMVHELEKETKRLAELISEDVKECKIGAWCQDCEHLGRDKATAPTRHYNSYGYVYCTESVRGDVMYCKKHLHEMCPEFSRKKGLSL